MPALLTRASLLSCFASLPRLLARASFDLAGSAHPYEYTFMLSKFAEPASSCFLQPSRVCSPVRVYFHATQVHRACLLVLHANLPSLLTRASLLSCFASLPSLLARASFDLAGSPHPCDFTFMLRKFVETARSCFLQPCRVGSPVRVYFHASQVCRACSVVLLATWPDMHTRASLLSCFAVRRACSVLLLATWPDMLTRASLHSCYASSPSQLARASCDLDGSAHLCEFTFMLRKFAEPARSCFLRPGPICSPAQVYIRATQVRRVSSLVLLSTLLCLLTPATLFSFFQSSLRLLARSSCDLDGSAHPCEFTITIYNRDCWLVLLATLTGLLTRASLLSRFTSTRSQLARASCDLDGSAHLCGFTFKLRKFAEPARSCFLRPGPICSPAQVYIRATQVRRVSSLVLLATWPDMLTRASLHSCYASSPSQLARASFDLAGSVYPCKFTFMLLRRAYLVVLVATLPGLLTCASLLSCFASSPSLLGRASCDLARYAHPRKFTFVLRKFAESARSCFFRPCWVCLPVQVYFHASSPSLLGRATCDLAGSAHLCEFTFMLRKFAEPARSCFLRPGPICSPAQVYIRATQVCRVSSLVLLSTLLGLLTRASLLSCFFTEPTWSCYLRPCRVCSPVRVYFHASQVREVCSLVLLSTLLCLLTPATLLSFFQSSLRLLAHSSCDLDGSAHPCEFTFMLRKFAEPARSCFLRPGPICTPAQVYIRATQVRRFAEPTWSCYLRPCRVCSPVRVYFHASQVREVCSLVLLSTLLCLFTPATLLSFFQSSLRLLARSSCDLDGSAHLCGFTFMLRKFAEPARSCILRPGPICSPAQVYIRATQVRRVSSLVLLSTLLGLLTRASLLSCFGLLTCASLLSCFASSRSLLARASFDLAVSPHPCDFTFILPKFVETAGSFFLRPGRVCSPVRVYFHASQVREVCSLVLLSTLLGLLTRASLLSCFFTITIYKYAELARSCFLRPGRVCSPLRVYFHASQVRRACSVVLLATWPDMLTCASLHSCYASSPSQLARASCDLDGSAHLCGFTFMLLHRDCWLVLLATLPGLLTRASLLSCLLSSPSLLGRATCDLAGSAHLCEFTFMLRKFAEPARSCILRPGPICSPAQVYIRATQVRRVSSLVLLSTLLGLLTRASLLSCFLNSPSLLGRATCDLAGSAHPYEFTFLLCKFAEPARSCILRPGPICSPAQVYIRATQVRRVSSLVLLSTLLGLLTRASLLSCFLNSPSLLGRATCDLAGSAHPYEFTFLLCKFAEPARSCFLRPGRVCSPVRFAEPARSCFLRPGPICSPLASLHSCYASSPSLLGRATCDLAGSAQLCEFTFMLLRRAYLVVQLATLPGLLNCASLLSCFASSRSLLARASFDLAVSPHPCDFTFMLRKFVETAGSFFLRPCLVSSPVRVYFHTRQVRGASSLVLLSTLLGLLTRATLLSCFASTRSQLARASFDLVGSPHPCDFTFMLRKFVETAGSFFLRPCLVSSPVRVYFHTRQVRGASSLVLLSTLLGLLTRATLLSCFASTRSQLARASFDLVGSPHPCDFTFMLRKFVETAGSFFLRPCLVSSPVRVYFHTRQVRGASSLVLLSTLLGLLTRATLLSCFVSSSRLLARSSCDLAWSAHPCEFTFTLGKYAEPARSCFLRPGLICSPAQVYIRATQVRRVSSLVLLSTLQGLLTCASLLSCSHRKFAESTRSCFFRPCRVCLPVQVTFMLLRRDCWLVLLATLPGLLTRASLLSCFLNSPSLLGRATCDLAGSAHPCEFTFQHRKFAESTRSCFFRPCRVCLPVQVTFMLLRRDCWLVLLATLPGLLTRASLLSCFLNSPSLLGRATCDLAGSAHPCEFTFQHRKFAESTRSCFFRPCRVCLPVQVTFMLHCWLVLLATLPGLLTPASLHSYFASSTRLRARSSCDLAGSAHPCEFTFILRKFDEIAGSFFLRPCRVCSPLRVYIHTSQVRRDCGLVLLATLPGLLTPASLHSYFASSTRLRARSSCDLAGSAHPCEFTFILRKFDEIAGSFFLRPCRVCSPLRVYIHTSQVRRDCGLVLLATLPGLLTPASLHSYFASSTRLRARSSCDLAGSAHPCEFTFILRKFDEIAGSFFLRPCRVCSPLRVYIHTSQVRRDCGLVLLATLPGLLTPASLHSYFASSTRLRARSSCDLAGSAHPCEFTFILRKFDEIAGSFFLRPCRVCSPLRVYIHTSQVRRDCGLVLLATLPGLLTPASLHSYFASSTRLRARSSCDLAGSAHPCEFTFILRKFDEIAGSFFLRPCRVCSPLRVYIHTSQVRRDCGLVLLATLPGLLTPASLHSYFASSTRLRARSSCDLAGSAHPCEFTFILRKFDEIAGSFFLRPCRVCSPLRVYIHTSQVRRDCGLVLLATLPGLLTRTNLLSCFVSSSRLLARSSCDLTGPAHPCKFTFLLLKFAEPTWSCYLRPCRVCSPVRVYFHASQVRRACSVVLLATWPDMLTRASLHSCYASSPSQLARASFDLAVSPHPCDFTFILPKFVETAGTLAGSAHPCEFTFILRKFDEIAGSFFLRPCLVSSPVRVYFHARQVRGACSLVLLTTLPGRPTWSAHPYEFTFMLSKFAEPARSCFLQPYRVCSPVRVYFHATQVRRACSLVLLANLPSLLIRASLLSCFASSPSLLARASCKLAEPAHSCEFTFMLRKFAEPACSCYLQTCRLCAPTRVYFHASQVREFCWLVLLSTLLGLLIRATLLSFFQSSLRLLAHSSCDLAGSAHLCEFTFTLRMYAEPARSCFLHPCRVCSPVRVYFQASQVRRAYLVVLLVTLPGLLTRASLLSCFASSPRLLARSYCDLDGSAHPCEFTITICNSPVRVYFHARQVRGACSLVLLTTLSGRLTYASSLSCFASSPSPHGRPSCDLARYAHPCECTIMLRKFAEPAWSCFLRPGTICTPMRVYILALQVRRACWLVLLSTLPGLLTRTNLLSCLASLPSLLARASCNLTGFAHRCEFTFMQRKFAETARSCFLQPCRVCSPV
ncbi:hypothetical protein CRG98_019454 [Punica granatum]|uniref:Uncharacterized protein n=1 Tax=Punica granatum TaxID=22663 RepID=A0A2I0JV10_PUNGR|nr:hypothetical protein CRG98_019454 [Punica granatum]